MSSVKVFRGDNWQRTWVITDAQNAPVNLAGASARVQVRNKDTDALLVNASTSNGFLIFQVPDGRIDMVVPKEQMVLPPGDYVFDVEVLEEIAKREAVHVILFAQTNEDADGAPIASKRSIHPVSAVMHFTRENGNTIIKFNKNRFGPTDKKIKFIYDAAKSLIVEDGIIEPSPLPQGNSPFKRPF